MALRGFSKCIGSSRGGANMLFFFTIFYIQIALLSRVTLYITDTLLNPGTLTLNFSCSAELSAMYIITYNIKAIRFAR